MFDFHRILLIVQILYKFMYSSPSDDQKAKQLECTADLFLISSNMFVTYFIKFMRQAILLIFRQHQLVITPIFFADSLVF